MSTVHPVETVPFKPRNIIVFSDGTGNSAAKLFKTNVWRIYEALDLTCPDQIALYDDGVGTASFQPLAILGGAFGFGLKRNVLDLYMFLCRTCRVDPEDPESHDRIFAVGFSRGAFTARVVVALVAHQGLIQGADGAELKRLATWAYRQYRADRFRNTIGVRALRWLRDGLFRAIEVLRRRPAYDQSANHMVNIEFLGVWDTVAAYGLPIDELTRGWDRWIWPMMWRDRRLSPRVKRACHALALDDERQTFFPVLWDESLEPACGRSSNLNQERISQVWFAGMHANVGGGYPDDALAFAPLCWLASEAQKCGLRFQENLRPVNGIPELWSERSSRCGPMHDSRKGLAAYYRYHPRPVDRLCHDDDGLVRIARPKIHESVFERILERSVAYAPIALPETYAVVTRDGEILDGDSSANALHANPYEESSQAAARVRKQQAAWNKVWWRRVVYFATVAATALVVLLPFTSTFDDAVAAADAYTPLRWFVDVLGTFVPGFAQGWLEHYRQKPAQLLIILLVLGILMWRGTALKQSIVDRMADVWQRQGLVARKVGEVAEPTDFVYRLRTSRPYTLFFRFLSGYFWPTFFGFVMWAVLVIVIPMRAAFELTSRAGWLCTETTTAASNGPWQFDFEPWHVCQTTGIEIVKGSTYHVQIALPNACSPDPEPPVRGKGIWKDQSLPVESPAGLASTRSLAFYAGLPFRRVVYAGWFVPILTIGTALPERHVLDKQNTTFTAARGGPLTLFVNDAIFPALYRTEARSLCFGWHCFYENNSGAPARVRVTRVSENQPSWKDEVLDPYRCQR